MMATVKWLLGAVVRSLILGGFATGYFAVRASLKEELVARPGTAHPTLSRQSCIDCHAPIAAEWVQSFHFRSVSGPYWERIRRKGYSRLFQTLRVPCMECHAPANVLDLPPGKQPARRREAAELGVDCVSCHVSEQGIVGPGRSHGAPDEVLADERFLDPMIASTTVCATCHEEQGDCSDTVTEWRRSDFAARGVSCLDCHMAQVMAPSVAAGPAHRRRSHRFFGDKDPGTLEKALNAHIIVTQNGKAVVQITNDRVGHALPAAGMNALVVQVSIEDELGAVIEQSEWLFGSRELIPGYLDFWPFRPDTSIPAGEVRRMEIPPPAGPGTIRVEFRYRDWFAIPDDDRPITRIVKKY